MSALSKRGEASPAANANHEMSPLPAGEEGADAGQAPAQKEVRHD